MKILAKKMQFFSVCTNLGGFDAFEFSERVKSVRYIGRKDYSKIGDGLHSYEITVVNGKNQTMELAAVSLLRGLKIPIMGFKIWLMPSMTAKIGQSMKMIGKNSKALSREE